MHSHKCKYTPACAQAYVHARMPIKNKRQNTSRGYFVKADQLVTGKASHLSIPYLLYTSELAKLCLQMHQISTPPTGLRNSDPALISKWTSNYTFLISFGFFNSSSAQQIVINSCNSSVKRLRCNSGDWHREAHGHSVGVGCSLHLIVSLNMHVSSNLASADDLQNLIPEQKMKQTFTVYRFFEHEIKYFSFGCPSSNYFWGFMTVSLLFV